MLFCLAELPVQRESHLDLSHRERNKDHVRTLLNAWTLEDASSLQI